MNDEAKDLETDRPRTPTTSAFDNLMTTIRDNAPPGIVERQNALVARGLRIDDVGCTVANAALGTVAGLCAADLRLPAFRAEAKALVTHRHAGRFALALRDDLVRAVRATEARGEVDLRAEFLGGPGMAGMATIMLAAIDVLIMFGGTVETITDYIDTVVDNLQHMIGIVPEAIDVEGKVLD